MLNKDRKHCDGKYIDRYFYLATSYQAFFDTVLFY